MPVPAEAMEAGDVSGQCPRGNLLPVVRPSPAVTQYPEEQPNRHVEVIAPVVHEVHTAKVVDHVELVIPNNEVPPQ